VLEVSIVRHMPRGEKANEGATRVRNLDVPNGFIHPLFYKKGDKIKADEFRPFPLMMKDIYFYYDIIASHELTEDKPWQYNHYSIPAVLKLWESEKEHLSILFQCRDRKSAKEPMIRALSYFLSCLFWLNGAPVKNVVNWEREVEALQIKPINCAERLHFIFTNIDLYHASIQLGELFHELTKMLYKYKAMGGRLQTR